MIWKIESKHEIPRSSITSEYLIEIISFERLDGSTFLVTKYFVQK